MILFEEIPAEESDEMQRLSNGPNEDNSDYGADSIKVLKGLQLRNVLECISVIQMMGQVFIIWYMKL